MKTAVRTAILTLLASAALPAMVPSAAFAQASTSKGATADTVTTQLPRSVRPSHYDLTVTPDAKALTFAGKAAITVDVVEATSAITLHAADLAIGKAILASSAGKAMGTASVALNAEAQTATLTFAKTITPGRYVLSIDYTGKINTQAFGLFALDYKAKDGTSKRALFTQFENSDARRFMPSWDEPFWKATFDLKAVVPTDEMAVGNLPVTNRKDLGGGKTLVTFGTSPKMSTYLLFFGVGDFERKTKMAGATEVGVLTKRGDVAQADYALNASADLLPWMNDYFGTAYPLPKLDHVAAPGRSQFFSAMENWGAIFYFENAMLLDPKIASNELRERIFTVVAHEMAHQWFGDLVTMSWWDDLWLNEGFASWMEGRATAKFHPEWHPELTALGSRESAMSQDSYVTTHPIIQHIATVEEASQAFDNITYSKGEATIRMLEAYAGSDKWQAGVQAYMRRYAHTNTVTDDLWREIDKTSGKPISLIAHDFTLQPGIPLVKVTESCAGGTTALALEQGEFTRDRPGKQPLAWRVPVRAAGAGGEAEMLLQGKGALKVAGCGPVVVNAGQTGYYRVQYDPRTFAQLTKGIGSVQPVDQLGILNDAVALGYAGNQPMADMLGLIAALPADASPQVMERAAQVIDGLADYARGNPARTAALSRFAAARLLPVLNALGWTPKANEPATAGNLRSTLIGDLGSLGEPTVVAEARRRLAASRSDPSAIDPSVRLAIQRVVAINADAATWDVLHEMARTETSAQVKTTLYAQLGLARDPALADKALALSLTDEPGVTTSPVIVSAVAQEHPDKAFDFVLANYDAVMKRVDASGATRFVGRLAQDSADPAMPGKLDAYAKGHLAAGSRRPVDEAIAKIQDRIKVAQTRIPEVDAWLAKAKY
ncbi:M1 family metallopeptidase [Novosphingobium sp. Leaf2]|uniref:M1 family metallopeptidase n=1 Tax=Novosphingobium sp. Leaf2 TaxID=1735670 RepID=UPI0006FEAC5C|nr:M1 family metallopeptidase [Novosphingobium sp. Leaf2]KQM19291.1 aminopeptidase [Novosphingobium sp. Leaf2]